MCSSHRRIVTLYKVARFVGVLYIYMNRGQRGYAHLFYIGISCSLLLFIADQAFGRFGHNWQCGSNGPVIVETYSTRSIQVDLSHDACYKYNDKYVLFDLFTPKKKMSIAKIIRVSVNYVIAFIKRIGNMINNYYCCDVIGTCGMPLTSTAVLLLVIGGDNKKKPRETMH